jgi:hypothetical protein
MTKTYAGVPEAQFMAALREYAIEQVLEERIRSIVRQKKTDVVEDAKVAAFIRQNPMEDHDHMREAETQHYVTKQPETAWAIAKPVSPGLRETIRRLHQEGQL